MKVYVRPDLTIEERKRLPKFGDNCPAQACYISSDATGGRVMLRRDATDIRKATNFLHEMIHRLMPDGMDPREEEAVCESGSAEIMDAFAAYPPLLRGCAEYARRRRAPGKTRRARAAD